MDTPISNDASQSPAPTAWHTQPAETVLRSLGSSHSGLSQAKANDRLASVGPNRLPEPARNSVWLIIISQLRNPLTFILFVAAAVSFLLGHLLDTIFICAVVIINITMGTFQEWRAEERAASLKKTLQSTPLVIRNGRRENVDLSEIVPGDVVVLESGTAVPADLRLLSTHDLKIDESLLTGESQVVDKEDVVLDEEDMPPGDRINMAFAGTMVTSGRGTGVVCATADRTELGRIASLLTEAGGYRLAP